MPRYIIQCCVKNTVGYADTLKLFFCHEQELDREIIVEDQQDRKYRSLTMDTLSMMRYQIRAER